MRHQSALTLAIVFMESACATHKVDELAATSSALGDCIEWVYLETCKGTLGSPEREGAHKQCEATCARSAEATHAYQPLYYDDNVCGCGCYVWCEGGGGGGGGGGGEDSGDSCWSTTECADGLFCNDQGRCERYE